MARAVREAGRIAMRCYGRARAEMKDDNTVVSDADRRVDAFLRRRLEALLSEAEYVSEESARDAVALGRAREAEWVWVADPIDGTVAFLEGIETFCISLGLLRHGRPYAGAVWLPALRHLYAAEAGRGVSYDGRPVRAIAERGEWDRTVLYVDMDAHCNYRIAWHGKTRNLGSAALHYLLVARGAAAGAVSTARVWDYAGAAAAVSEAGGWMRHLDGRPVDWRAALDGRPITPPVLAAPPCWWDELAARITWAPADGGPCQGRPSPGARRT